MSAALTFVAPPPGLSPLLDFTLDEVDGVDGLFALRADDDAGIRLFVVDAGKYVGDYSPEISDEQSAALGIIAATDALVLVVANPAMEGTTVNLLAPIVVNSTTGAAAQFILEGQDWPLRAPLVSFSA